MDLRRPGDQEQSTAETDRRDRATPTSPASREYLSDVRRAVAPSSTAARAPNEGRPHRESTPATIGHGPSTATSSPTARCSSWERCGNRANRKFPTRRRALIDLSTSAATSDSAKIAEIVEYARAWRACSAGSGGEMEQAHAEMQGRSCRSAGTGKFYPLWVAHRWSDRPRGRRVSPEFVAGPGLSLQADLLRQPGKR